MTLSACAHTDHVSGEGGEFWIADLVGHLIDLLSER